jgi:hypothetical protein
MDIATAALIAEIIGAIAVVISLIYLSSQIRHGTKTAEDAAFRDVFASVGDLMAWMNAAPNKSILMKGLIDFRSLKGEEKFVFDSMLTMLVTLVESSVISNAAELVKDETMENWADYLGGRYFEYPGAREWWAGSKTNYISELQECVDRMIDAVDHESDYWAIKTPTRFPTEVQRSVQE